MKLLYYAFSSLVILSVGLSDSYAQTSGSNPAHLAPIERAPGSSILGSIYYYKGRRLNSPFSIEIPIQELNDPVANRHFRRFKTWTTVGRLTGLASVAYVLFNRTSDPQTRRTVYVGSLIASVGFTFLSNAQVNKAVRQYNSVLAAPRVGFSLTTTLYGTTVAGVGMNIAIVPKAH